MHGSRLVTNPRQFASPSPPRAGFFHFWRTIIDRVLVYPGAIPLEVDVLNTNKNAAFALGQLCQDAFGQGVTGPFFTGLACVPNTPAAMNVIVQPGAVYAQAALDTTAYSSLAADSTVTMKQGILKSSQTFATPAPTTSGQSIVYLISASFLEADTNAVVLPYYNASNPSQAYSGPNGTGSSQNTTRQDTVALTLTTGVPATTGSQLTPATPNGQTALYTITVAYGATSVTAANIAKSSAFPVFSGFLRAGLYAIAANTVLNATHANSSIIMTGAVSYGATLPPSTVIPSGMTVSFLNATAVAQTISTSGADTYARSYSVGGLSSLSLGPGDNVTFSSNGTSGWYVTDGSVITQTSGLFGSSLGSSGYQKLPSGVIVQWGSGSSTAATSNNATVTFPIAFPNACLTTTQSVLGSAAGNYVVQQSNLTKTIGTFTCVSSGAYASGIGFSYIAIGY